MKDKFSTDLQDIILSFEILNEDTQQAAKAVEYTCKALKWDKVKLQQVLYTLSIWRAYCWAKSELDLARKIDRLLDAYFLDQKALNRG